MRITTTQPLFAWEAPEDGSYLRTIREFLAAVPDARLLNNLHQWRERGRDDHLRPEGASVSAPGESGTSATGGLGLVADHGRQRNRLAKRRGLLGPGLSSR